MKRKTSKFFAALISVIVAVSVLTVTVLLRTQRAFRRVLKNIFQIPKTHNLIFRIPRLLTMTPIGLFLYYQDAAKRCISGIFGIHK